MRSQHFLSKAPGEIPEPTGATNVRMPSTQYLVIDSADRQQNAAFNNSGNLVPWNNFRIQKRQSILNAFARRIQPTEIRFPWFIPNITEYNNSITFTFQGLGTFTVSIPLYTPGTAIPPNQYIGFYTPSEIVTALNSALALVPGLAPDVPVVAYDSATMTYSITNPVGSPYPMKVWADASASPLSANDYYAKPSLFKTLGFQLQQSQGLPVNAGTVLTGLPTMSSYTDYVDICSDKLMYYTDVKDGSSADRSSSSSVVIRLYACDEVSIPTVTAGVPLTCSPFIIHRQFKNAKSIQWNAEAVIDWLDMQIYDMYGNLVPLPKYRSSSASATTYDGAYPDFQVTFLASEN
jgi:hypothetical protein